MNDPKYQLGAKLPYVGGMTLEVIGQRRMISSKDWEYLVGENNGITEVNRFWVFEPWIEDIMTRGYTPSDNEREQL